MITNRGLMKHFTNRIEEHMSEFPCFASGKTSVKEADEFMQKMGFRHLPIVEHGKVVGVVSERNLKQAKLHAQSSDLTLDDVMTRDPFCVTVGTPLSTVAKAMAKQKVGSAVITDTDGKVIGIFTNTDGMRILGSLLEDMPGQDAFEHGVENFLQR